jgi:hypothetical protein
MDSLYWVTDMVSRGDDFLASLVATRNFPPIPVAPAWMRRYEGAPWMTLPNSTQVLPSHFSNCIARTG